MTPLTAMPPPGRALPADPAARRRAAIEIGVLQGLYVLFLLPWFMVAIGGVMAAGTAGTTLAALLIYAWFGYPFVALGTTVAAWVLFGTRSTAAARWVNRVPLLWVVVGGAVLTWVFTAG
ncbi:hypothetical protein [Blastococcus sp. SYSU DS1024]